MNYPGRNKPLTVENATDIISRLHSLYSDRLYNIEEMGLNNIAKLVKKGLWEDNSNEVYTAELFMLSVFVGSIHKALGGQWITDQSEQITEEALIRLSENGKAQQISEKKWRIPPLHQQIFGDGEGWVYLYYFDKKKAEARDQGNAVWPCKIGRTGREPEKRIQEQLEDADIPMIALLLRTDKPKVLERTIHGILTLRGVHLRHVEGKEWFLTNPDEIIDIYRFIVNKNVSLT